MKRVTTLDTAGYDADVKAVKQLNLTDLKKGVTGNTINGRFHAYGVNSAYEIIMTNGITINKSTLSDVKKWIMENLI